MLPDGVYDAIVVDGDEDARGVRLELTITAGAHKGEVVAVRGSFAKLDVVNTLGLPARLVVNDGMPSVELEP